MVKGDLSPELRALVRRAVAVLGEVIQYEAGRGAYQQIEAIRSRMAGLRGGSSDEAYQTLNRTLKELEKLSRAERAVVAHSFTLMLELMNACENAYRSYRLRRHVRAQVRKAPAAMIYVVTAHPTEARSPQNIAVFHGIQKTLTELLEQETPERWTELRNGLEIAWQLAVAKNRRPQVRDEAEHVYSILLRDESLEALLAARKEFGPIFIRSWVGGDKDGHPGVDEKTLVQSLQLSRARLIRFFRHQLARVRHDLVLVDRPALVQLERRLEAAARALGSVRAGDGKRVAALHQAFAKLARTYEDSFGVMHPALSDLRLLIRIFPALVIPMELRDSADLMHEAAAGKPIAIRRMCAELGRIARGSEPRFYARGLIISMASRSEDIFAAARLLEQTLGGPRIPVIPLFEQGEALAEAPAIVKRILENPRMLRVVKKEWGGYFEIMLGYSDSAKELGALASRMSIMEAVQKLDRLYKRYPVTPIFFHGSGGSTDRGGGTIEEQTDWWPESALDHYKATIQGEMVERAFASPEIVRRRFEQIARQLDRKSSKPPSRASLQVARELADRISFEYRKKISTPELLDVVTRGTAYRYLSALRIGSRPSKRGKVLSVSALRAIPWVLCWTQARVLFPTWWGAGAAWRELRGSKTELAALRRAFAEAPIFTSYVKILASTLARVELPVWRVFLEQSDLPPALIRATLAEFETEYKGAVELVRAISGTRDLLWFRPWFGTSIRLRSPMIHPLNLLQCLAIRDGDSRLLRETVTGIASGMMTTG